MAATASPVQTRASDTVMPTGQGPGIAAVLAIAAGETAAIVAVVKLVGANAALLLTVHAATLGILLWLVRRTMTRSADTSVPLLALLATTALGPAGALGAALLGWLATLRPADVHLLEDWYERISLSTAVDPVTRLCDDVSVGRTLALDGAAPESYLGIMERGSLSERQIVLGHVARHFHSDYLPVLKAALMSPEPVIRVQAAAVAAHVRPSVSKLFAACVAQLPAAASDVNAALELLAGIDALVASGLLDEGDRKRGIEIAGRLGDVATAQRVQAHGTTRALVQISSAGARAAFERLLVARGRFAALRCFRNEARVLMAHPAARVRRLGTATALSRAGERRS